MRLTKDIVSNKTSKGGTGKIYGKKGEKVTLISEHGDVLVVEKASGERLSVHKDFVS